MTEEEELLAAVERAEAELAVLEQEHQALTERRRSLTEEQRRTLQARRAELTASVGEASEALRSLGREKARLRRQLLWPRARWPAFVASPLVWFFRAAAFTAYVSSVVAAHHLLHSAGLVFALVLGLPVAFVLVMVAASLRESGAAQQAGDGAGQGHGAASQPAVDERAVAPAGGPGDDRAADLGARGTRTGADDGT